MNLNNKSKIIFSVLLVFILAGSINAQYDNKWLAVGSHQNWYSSIGIETEEGYVASQQYGWQWPAIYPFQDMQADKSIWIGTTNYTETNGTVRPYKVVHAGPRVNGAGEFFPIEFKRISKYEKSYPMVDYVETYKNFSETDEVNPDLDCDEMLSTVVNTSIGVTMKRKIKAWSNPYMDNFHLVEYTFVNTGLISGDQTTKRPDATLQGVYFGFTERLAVVRQIRYYVGNNSGWGVNTMLDTRGDGRLDADNPNNLRFQYAWHGYYGGNSGVFIKPASAPADWDNIGCPVVQPDGSPYHLPKADTNWRLGAPQFIGMLTVHADNSAANKTDDPSQPSTTDWTSSDGPLMFSNDQYNAPKMSQEYAAMSKGHRPIRHAEYIEPTGNYLQSTNDPAVGSTNSAGYKHISGYGPYTLAPGDSITIIIADASDGITREEAVQTGLRYKKGQMTTLDKNKKVFEGKDKLFATFEKIKAANDMGWQIPNPPAPPTDFLLLSRGGKIDMSWNYTADPGAPITGFKLYRSIDGETGVGEANEGYERGVYYTKYELAAELPADARAYADTAVQLNQPYFYYLTAVGEQIAAVPELGIPAGALESSRYYTQTYAGATMKRKGLDGLYGKVRVVPNPAIAHQDTDIQYDSGRYLNFANLPGECKIQIFTEIGELVNTLEHTDGSGDAYWTFTTSSNQIVASGIYIAVITDTKTGKNEIVKFVVIR